MMIQTPQALIDNGWNYYEKCRCQRILKYKYRHPGKPGLELEWWVKYFQFKITEKNKTKIPLTKIGELGNTLKTL